MESTLIPHEDGRTKVVLQLVGINGNAFSVMGHFRSAARKQGFNKDWIQSVLDEAMSGDYNHLLGTIVPLCVDSPAESLVKPAAPESSDDECLSNYEPLWWGKEHPMQGEYDRIWGKFIPSSGACFGYGDDEPQTIPQMLLSFSRMYYDLYNNGLCNDKTEEAEFIIENFELIEDFFENEQQAKEALYVIKFYLSTFRKEEDQDTTCHECGGDGGEYVSNSWSGDEDNEEEEWEDCDYCDGSGYIEEEYTDYLEWIYEDRSNIRALDRGCEAALKCVIAHEDDIEPTHPRNEIDGWNHKVWKKKPYSVIDGITHTKWKSEQE